MSCQLNGTAVAFHSAMSLEPAMLRISTATNTDGTTLLLVEGVIADDDDATLDEACREQLVVSPCVKIDLAKVTYVDAAGLACLNRLRQRGIEIHARSPFISELLKRSHP